MPSAVPRDERLPQRYQQSPADVFCLLKHSLADVELSQPALLVFPGAESDQAREFWRRAANHPGIQSDVDGDRARDLLELADVLETWPQYGRAVAFMRGLAGQTVRTRRDAWPLEFIEAGGAAPRIGLPQALPDRPERPIPHRMHVRFHRP